MLTSVTSPEIQREKEKEKEREEGEKAAKSFCFVVLLIFF
jgi:hypothetical protein